MIYTVRLTAHARAVLEQVRDKRVQGILLERMQGLAQEPEKQGKPLWAELQGYRSIRAAGQRWRIIYKVEHAKVVVLVVALGSRKQGDRADVYELARKLLKRGLLE